MPVGCKYGFEIKELMDIISKGETLKIEFKSDLKQLSDRELVATVINISNTEGGDLLLGMEDDGSITACILIIATRWESWL